MLLSSCAARTAPWLVASAGNDEPQSASLLSQRHDCGRLRRVACGCRKLRSWALTCNDAQPIVAPEMTGSGAYAASLPPILIGAFAETWGAGWLRVPE